MIESVVNTRRVVSRPGERDAVFCLIVGNGSTELVRDASNRSSNSVGSGECSPSGSIFTCNSDDDQVAGSEVVRVRLENVLVDDAFNCSSSGGAREVVSVVLVVRALDLDLDSVGLSTTDGAADVDSHGTSDSLGSDSGHDWWVVSEADVEDVRVWVITTATTDSSDSESEVLRVCESVVKGVLEVDAHGGELSVVGSNLR